MANVVVYKKAQPFAEARAVLLQAHTQLLPSAGAPRAARAAKQTEETQDQDELRRAPAVCTPQASQPLACGVQLPGRVSLQPRLRDRRLQGASVASQHFVTSSDTGLATMQSYCAVGVWRVLPKLASTPPRM